LPHGVKEKRPAKIAGRFESGDFPALEGTFLVNHAAHAASLALADDIGITSVAPEEAARGHAVPQSVYFSCWKVDKPRCFHRALPRNHCLPRLCFHDRTFRSERVMSS
jgi:hypothetical protein